MALSSEAVRTSARTNCNHETQRVTVASVTAEPELKYELRFSISSEMKKQLTEAKLLLSNKYPKGVSLEDLFGELLTDFLKRKSKSRDRVRNSKSRATGDTDSSFRTKEDADILPLSAKQELPSSHNPRHIRAKLKREVYTRDQGCCTYLGSEKERCGSRWNLQIDHVVPYAVGGETSLENLRLLCAEHNRLLAEQYFGTAHVQRKVQVGVKVNR